MRGALAGSALVGLLLCLAGIWLALAVSNAAVLLAVRVHHVVVCALNEHLRWCEPGSALHFSTPPLLFPAVVLGLVVLGVGARVGPPIYQWWRYDRQWRAIAKRNAT